MLMIHVAAAATCPRLLRLLRKFDRVTVSTGIAGGHNHGNDPIYQMYIRCNDTLSIHYLEIVIRNMGKKQTYNTWSHHSRNISSLVLTNQYHKQRNHITCPCHNSVV